MTVLVRLLMVLACLLAPMAALAHGTVQQPAAPGEAAMQHEMMAQGHDACCKSAGHTGDQACPVLILLDPGDDEHELAGTVAARLALPPDARFVAFEPSGLLDPPRAG